MPSIEDGPISSPKPFTRFISKFEDVEILKGKGFSSNCVYHTERAVTYSEAPKGLIERSSIH